MPAPKIKNRIDVDKFKKLIAQNPHTRNMSLTRIAVKLGYLEPDSLKRALERGTFTKRMIKSLDDRFGIKYEEYAFVESDVQPEQFRSDKYYIDIYEVIKGAIIDALSEYFDGGKNNADT